MPSIGTIIWIMFCAFDISVAWYRKAGALSLLISAVWAAWSASMFARGDGMIIFACSALISSVGVILMGINMLVEPPGQDTKIWGNRLISLGINIVVAGVAWALS